MYVITDIAKRHISAVEMYPIRRYV